MSKQLDDNNPVKENLLNVLDHAFKFLDTRDPLGTDAFYDSVPPALAALNAAVADAGAPMDVDIIGIGHAHIDFAWLWTLGQTQRKVGRTFSNVLRLMEQYPDYVFTQSQPQLYQYCEEDYPEIFAAVKERVAEGRWQLIGGAWVEPDCNAIGSESLARQFLLGRNYFRRHFGDVETPVLWLPDTFGYSWALPQLIEQAGKKYFITHKMSWNQYNHMPDPVADQGWHNMVYSLLPHTGDWRGEVVQQAYDLNNPVIMTKTGFWNDPAGHPYQHSLVSVDKPNVIIETVKQAEYGEGIILRLYEHHRKRGRVALRAGFHLATAYECNLLE